ncbi:MAG: sigma-70 family RNA polymerase sigma factor [Gemmataceae bacterium]
MTAASLFRSVAAPAPDADLLGRFLAARDEAAFAELVRRHGPVVYRVCRRIVGPGSADDAFQATFLVLATRGGRVQKAASVGSWLVGVAGRVARQMRKSTSGRRQSAVDAGSLEQTADAGHSPELFELAAVLDDELTRLPDRLRGPLVACLVQHRTHKQAAAELGESERTLRRRLDEAKRLLRLRLERRGVVPAVAAGLVCGLGAASASVPRELANRAVHLAFDFLAGGTAVASAPAVIAKGVSMTLMSRLTNAAMACAAVGLTALGVGLAGDPPKAERIPPVDWTPKPSDLPNLTFFYHGPTSDVKTKNFVVECSDAVVGRAVANEAEHQRKVRAEKWLGKELPAWDKPCLLEVKIDLSKSAGVSTFTYGDGGNTPKLRSLQMNLSGSFEQILRTQLPHEVTHAVLATHFGKQLPRWADEGIALTAETYHEQATHDALCREVLNAGRGIRLSHLLPMTDYPQDVPVLYAQGHSLVRFLLSRRVGAAHLDDAKKEFKSSEQVLVTFLAQMLNEKVSWEDAASAVYGFKDLDAMQEAWLDWLRTPASSLADALPPQKPKPADGRKADDTLIPPTRLGK